MNDGTGTYQEMVNNGHYERFKGGLFGKFDNVRVYWEDRITQIALRPYIKKIAKETKGVRILDLGCGSGQGYELLTNIDKKDMGLELRRTKVLPPELIDKYHGIDLSDAMIEKGRQLYRENEKVCFERQDLREGLSPIKEREAPYDMYLSCYASLSHLTDEELKRLFVDIANNARDKSLIVGDWIGRLSIEWPDYWSLDADGEKMRDYSMSYLYSKEERDQKVVEHFPLRFWARDEILKLIHQVSLKTGIEIKPLRFFDRSIFVGRHTDTGEYNPQIQPIRSKVNELHEINLRTDLEKLIVKYIPKKEGLEKLSGFYERFQFCWNSLIKFCQRRLNERVDIVRMRGWERFPPVLQLAIITLDRVIDSVIWMRMGDPRANIIEPQLGYVLRGLEMELQQGIGCGHGLVGIFEVRR